MLNGLEFTIVRPFNWIGPEWISYLELMVQAKAFQVFLAYFSTRICTNHSSLWMVASRKEPLFISRDATEAVLLMIENPVRANGHILNVGNPNNEVTVRQLAEMMTG